MRVKVVAAKEDRRLPELRRQLEEPLKPLVLREPLVRIMKREKTAVRE